MSLCDIFLTATISCAGIHKLFCFFEQFPIMWKVSAQNDAFLSQYNLPFRRNFSAKTLKFPETLRTISRSAAFSPYLYWVVSHNCV